MIKIIEEQFQLTKLNITNSNTSYPIDIYIKIPGEYTHDEFITKMETDIDKTLQKGDIIGLYETTKKFIALNNIEYYEVYKIG